jgi:hypothetical protein
LELAFFYKGIISSLYMNHLLVNFAGLGVGSQPGISRMQMEVVASVYAGARNCAF